MARGRAPSRPTTRTRRRWVSKPPGAPSAAHQTPRCVPSGSPRSRPPISTRPTRRLCTPRSGSAATPRRTTSWVRCVRGSVRSAPRSGALVRASSSARTPVIGLPGGPDEATGGDGAAALLVGDDADGPVLAELVTWQSSTEEFLDRWRTPGDVRSKVWEERFGETRYTSLGVEAWEAALKDAGLVADQIDHLVVTSTHRARRRRGDEEARCRARARRRRARRDRRQHGCRAPGADVVSRRSRRPGPNQTIALVVLADGADTIILRTTAAIVDHASTVPVDQQVGGGAPITYGKYLAWRGLLPVEPPRRPEPARPSASAAGRSIDWKYGFVGSEGDDGVVHLPPSAQDDIARPMADATGTIVTFTVDKLAYSPSPPVVFAVVDFDGGGRVPIELTDVDPTEVAIGGRVEMTFRKLFTSDGIHNYFWKGRLVRDAAPVASTERTTDGFARDQGPRRDRRDGLHALRRALGQGRRRSVDRCGRRGVQVGGRRQGRRRRVLARHRAVRHERDDARQAVAARRQARDPGRELLRDRFGGVAPGGVRRRERRVRRRDGDRRREGQGLRLPGPQRVPDPDRRHESHADRGRDVLDGRAGVREEVRRHRRRDEDGARQDRVEEPLQRRAQPARAVPARDVGRAAVRRCLPVAGQLSVFDCAGVADGAAAAIVVRAEDAEPLHAEPAVHQGVVVRRGQRQRPDRPDVRLHDVPRDRRVRARMRTRRPESPIRAASSRWPRCTTASRRPSSS